MTHLRSNHHHSCSSIGVSLSLLLCLAVGGTGCDDPGVTDSEAGQGEGGDGAGDSEDSEKDEDAGSDEGGASSSDSGQGDESASAGEDSEQSSNSEDSNSDDDTEGDEDSDADDDSDAEDGSESGDESGSDSNSDSGGDDESGSDDGSDSGTESDSDTDDDGGDGGGDTGPDDDEWPMVNVAPSVDPPGGLSVEQAPMFVSFGWDDNAYTDAVWWFADHVRDMKNPDGSPVRSTFFMTAGFAKDKLVTDGGQTEEDVVEAWRMLFDDGHEIANHTWNHDHGRGKDKAWWLKEIEDTTQFFVDDLNIHPSRIYGFRTPFLEYGTGTFEALRAVNMRYDCSIEFGYDWWSHEGPNGMVGHSPGDPETGKWYYWPYTLDNGTPGGSSDAGAGKSPGMWEIPVYTYNKLQGDMVSRITGFDFNMWKTMADADEFLEVLKYSFDQRRTGNRSPFTFNAHTDFYSQYNPNDDPEFNEKDYLERRRVVEEFLAYVLSFEEVRVVTFVDIIKWMRDPEPLRVR